MKSIINTVKRSGVLRPYIAFVLFTSGVTVCGLQALTLPFWWLSRDVYRKLNRRIVELFWLEFVWLAQWWSKTRLVLYLANEETDRLTGHEQALVICNHGSDVDWLIGWLAARNYDVLGATRGLVKRELGMIPVFGWSWWFMEFPFLSRNWKRDRGPLHQSLANLSTFPFPYWLILFAEGTRFTTQKYNDMLEYCKKAGKTPFKNVLYPRTKGFTATLTGLRDKIPAIMVCTFGFPKNTPSFSQMIDGSFDGEIHMHVERVAMKDVPESEEDMGKWLIQRYREMDERLEQHKRVERFEGIRKAMPRSMAAAWATTFWMCLINIAGLAYLVMQYMKGHYWPIYVCIFLVVAGDLALRVGLGHEKYKDIRKQHQS